MIIEDEVLERKALRFLVQKFFSDSIEVVGEASNGKIGVEKAILYKPDLILMDIRMPIMDGIEASRLIKSNRPETEFIIFTAYNDFEYAKQAINIGVNDYLLKPCPNEEFKEAINKVINKIEARNTKTIESEQLKENYQKIIPYLEKQMVVNVVYGVKLNDKQIDEYRNILNIDSLKFCSIVFNLEDKNIDYDDVLQFIKNKLDIMFPKIVGGVCLNDIILFIFDKDVESKIFSKRFDIIIDNLRNEFKNKKSAELYMGLGAFGEGFNKLYSSYSDAKRNSESQNKKDSMINNNVSNIKTNETNYVICGRIINEDLEGAVLELDNIINNLINGAYDTEISAAKSTLLIIIKNIIESINEFVGKDFKKFDDEKILNELSHLTGFSDLKNYCTIVIKKLIDYVSNYKKSKNIDVVEKIKKYIGINYMKDLSLDLLAQYVSLSSFYISRIFTKVEGINVRDYIIKIRMEKAKTMLLEGNKTIKQIAIEVGYIDQNYFSKAFKKYTNVSPKEYGNR
jgi:YesN/AraC family two-component response regulator